MENKKFIQVSAVVSVYNGLKYLPAFLENTALQTAKDSLEIVLVHNEPSTEESALVKEFSAQHPDLINHLVVGREPLAVSMNRAIENARGEYVCIWNVDDLRTPNSIELMTGTLLNHREIGFTYGDFVIVTKWQSQKGELVISPEYDRRLFVQNMHAGPFYMWRKSLCQKLGYFDEQFKSGADFDYAVRLALETKGLKTKGLLGYYLNEGLGLSTGKTPWQPIERTMIELRYGTYHKLDFFYVSRALKYKLNLVLKGSEWKSLSALTPHLRDYWESKWWLAFALCSYPFWLLKRIIKKLIKAAPVFERQC